MRMRRKVRGDKEEDLREIKTIHRYNNTTRRQDDVK
jgi:hypothetical protein